VADLFLLSRVQMRRIERYFPLPHGIARVDDRRIVVRAHTYSKQSASSQLSYSGFDGCVLSLNRMIYTDRIRSGEEQIIVKFHQGRLCFWIISLPAATAHLHREGLSTATSWAGNYCSGRLRMGTGTSFCKHVHQYPQLLAQFVGPRLLVVTSETMPRFCEIFPQGYHV
jgi:hypothetical protein